MDRIDFLRHECPPVGSLLYVFQAGTNTPVQLYSDSAKTVPINQPITMGSNSVHFYAENTRVDMKIVHTTYPAGFVLIEDQILFDWDDVTLGETFSPLETDYDIAVPNSTTVDIGLAQAEGLYEVYLNGIRLRQGIGRDYILNGQTIEFQTGWRLFVGDIVTVLYFVQ